MGWFDDERVVSVSASGVLLLEDEPNILRNAIVQAIGAGQGIPENIQHAYRNGLAGSINSFYNRGKYSFYRGLPEGGSDQGDGQLGFDYYPAIPLRKGSDTDSREMVNITLGNGAYKYPEVVADTENILRTVGFKLDDLTDGIASNADIDNIDDVFLVMGTDVLSTEQASLEYMHYMFKSLDPNNTSKALTDTWFSDPRFDAPRNAFTFKESKNAEGNTLTFKAEIDVLISYIYIEHKTVTKNIGVVGTYSSEYALGSTYFRGAPTGGGGTSTRPCADAELVYNPTTGNVDWDCYETVDQTYETNAFIGLEDTSTLKFYRQISDTECEEVLVRGLEHYSTVFEGKKALKNLATASATVNGKRTDTGLFIPLRRDIVDLVPIQKRNSLMHQSLYMFFYSSDVSYLAWYEQQGFLDLIKVIAYAAAILSFIYTLGSSATVSAAIIALATQLAVGVAAYYAIQAAASYFDNEVLLAIIAVLVIASIAAGVFVPPESLLPTASQLLDATLVVGQVLNESLQQDIQAVMEEGLEASKAYNIWAENHQELLDELEANEVNTSYTEGLLMRDNIIINESPTSFFERSIHSGNVGVKSLDAIGSYVTNSLQLPKLN